MALPETENMVTVRRLSSVVNGVWGKAKDLFATKVANPTNGNFAGLGNNGNLTDSGSKASDFATAAQGTTADSAIQGVKVDGSLLTPDANRTVNVQLPQASASTPLVDGTATAGTETTWAKGDHVHPTDTSRQAVLNMDSSIPAAPSEGHYPSSKAVADFVNSSISTNTANFLGSFTLTDLGLTYPATDAEIADALAGHAWPTGVTPTNNDYTYVEIQDPQTTGIDDKVERFKFNGTNWMYEYTLNNSSFTAAEVAALESGVTGTKVGSYDAHLANTNNPHSVTKSQVGLGSVVDTGDSATPVSGGTTKFTTGGAYTELAKKVDKETGKGLSANDFTNTYKTKLDGIASGAEVNVQSDWNQSDNTKDDYIKNKPNLATVATSGSYNDLSNKPTIPAAQVNSDWNAASGVAQILNKPNLATVATSGSYNDLSNKPTIPAAQVNSDWNASSGVSAILNKPNLATVATSGSYNDLSNKPSIPAAQVNSDWNAASGVAQILNKPSLAAVATSGAYSDLSGTPTIPAAANNGVLTITQNGTSKGTFSANQSGNNTIALTDTTYSQISRGSGAGLAPGLPSGSGTSKYLREDGTWQAPAVDINEGSPASGTFIELRPGGGYVLSVGSKDIGFDTWAGKPSHAAELYVHHTWGDANIPVYHVRKIMNGYINYVPVENVSGSCTVTIEAPHLSMDNEQYDYVVVFTSYTNSTLAGTVDVENCQPSCHYENGVLVTDYPTLHGYNPSTSPMIFVLGPMYTYKEVRRT